MIQQNRSSPHGGQSGRDIDEGYMVAIADALTKCKYADESFACNSVQ